LTSSFRVVKGARASSFSTMMEVFLSAAGCWFNPAGFRHQLQ
jgi:hypothetical protein